MSLRSWKIDSSVKFQISSTADLLVTYFHQLRVRKIFGIPGGALEPFSDALGRAEQAALLQVISARHECGAAYMAQAYGVTCGTLGVCFVTTGPGATNALTAVASAYAEEIPLLIITAQNNQSSVGRRPFQDSSSCGVDSMAIFSSCTRYNAQVNHPQQLERHLVNAVQHAFADVKGPVHLSLPGNVLTSASPSVTPNYDLRTLLQKTPSLNHSVVQKMAEKISSASKPLFVLGEGAHACASQVLSIAELLNGFVVTTPAAKGIVDWTHRCYRGVCGFAGHGSAIDLLADSGCSLLVLIGTALDEWDIAGNADELFRGKELIHLDEVEQHLFNSPMAQWHLHCDIKNGVEQLWQQVRKIRTETPLECTTTFVHSLPAKTKKAEQQMERSIATCVHPRQLMAQLSMYWPEKAICFTDVGNSSAWAIHYLQPSASTEKYYPWFKTTTRFSAMGWGLGQAIGHALANPAQQVICIIGDGAMLMNGQEISVAQEHGLNILFIVLNDGAYGMVKHGQKLNQAESVGNILPDVDFTLLAQSLGVQSYKVTSGRELLQLNWSNLYWQDGPVLLDVKIDSEAVPPIDVRTRMIKEGNIHE